MNGDGEVIDLIAEVKRIEDTEGMPIALVVFDTLSQSMAGGNENGPEDMTTTSRSRPMRVSVPAGTSVHVIAELTPAAASSWAVVYVSDARSD